MRFEQSNNVRAGSEHLAQTHVRRLGCARGSVPGERGRVLYDGVPMPAADMEDPGASVRREFGLGPDIFLAVMFARVAPQKDFETLIEAAALLRAAYPQVRFLIVGDHDSTDFISAHYAKVFVIIIGLLPSDIPCIMYGFSFR